MVQEVFFPQKSLQVIVSDARFNDLIQIFDMILNEYQWIAQAPIVKKLVDIVFLNILFLCANQSFCDKA